MKINKRIGVLSSGGLDSAALIAHYLEKGFEVWPVYVRCGLRWEALELWWLRRYLKALSKFQLHSLKIISLTLENSYSRNWSQTGDIPGPRSPDSAVFLPARNLLLITKSLLFLSSKGIYRLALGTLKGNPFKDASPSYFKLLENILTKSFAHPVKIEVPFRNQSKVHIIKKYQNYPLYLSFSCINPNGKNPCAHCNKCAERKRAFQTANVDNKQNI